jgi:hypothetical protein
MLLKFTTLSSKPLRWHDGALALVGPNSILETDSSNIVNLGGVAYIAGGSQVNVLLNTAGPTIGIGESMEDLPVKRM